MRQGFDSRSAMVLFVICLNIDASHNVEYLDYITSIRRYKAVMTGLRMKLFVYPVRDLAASKALFSRLLGVQPYVDGTFYVGFRVEDQEIGLDPNAHSRGVTTPIGYVEASDIRGSLKSLVEAGAKVHQDVHDVGGGLLIATVVDPDGNILGLRQSP
jgi:predicted enzyme related to lactoylglutathione lyase